MTDAVFISLSCCLAFLIVYLGLNHIMDLRQKKLRMMARISLDHDGKQKVHQDNVSLFQKRRASIIEKKLHDYISKFRSENWLQLELYRAGISVNLTQSLILFVVFVVGMTIISSYFILWSFLARLFLFCFLTLFVMYFTLEFLKSRRQNMVIKHLPTALDIILRALKAGYSVEKTFVVVAKEMHPSVGNEFRQIVDQMNIGVSYEDSLRHAAERIHTSDFYFLANALIIQRQTGGSLSETLENILYLLHRRHEIRLKTLALSAEAKSTGLILGVIPFAIWAIVSVMKPEYLDFFFYDESGSQLLKLVIGLLVLEAFIIKWLVNIKVE